MTKLSHRSRFQFVYHGNFDPDYWKETLKLRSAITVEGTGGFKYAIIKTGEKRDRELEKHFQRHDMHAPENMKIKLTNLDGYPRIVSFEKGEMPELHPIFKTAMELKNSPSFSEWGSDMTPIQKHRKDIKRKKANHDTRETKKAHSISEFDVVKKRKTIQSSPSEPNDTCPDALVRFEEFEAAVLQALINIDKDDKEHRHKELLTMEQDLCNGTAQPVTGAVYVATSKALKYPKIGATRRSDPLIRVRELSRHVPSPFQLVYWIPTTSPFKLESEIHEHFTTSRIKEKGACTEFFDLDLQTIGDYLKAKYFVLANTETLSE